MIVKEAISIAKAYVAEIYSDENIKDIGLEEVRQEGDFWIVTIGFYRAWDEPKSVIQQIQNPTKRTYKKIWIKDSTSEITQIDNRN